MNFLLEFGIRHFPFRWQTLEEGKVFEEEEGENSRLEQRKEDVKGRIELSSEQNWESRGKNKASFWRKNRSSSLIFFLF